MDEKQIRAIVVFGDIIGFGSFTQRITHADSEFRPFIRQFDGVIDEFEERTGYFVKRLGDGFMCVVELASLHPERQAMAVIDAIWILVRQLNTIITTKETPRPEGFRARVVCGYVWKTIRRNNREDYLGYHVNLSEKTLHTNKQVEFICHESVKELIQHLAKTKGYAFKKLANLDGLEDIYKQDLNLLWTVTKGGKRWRGANGSRIKKPKV